MANWRLARSLVVLQNQVNKAYPNRSKASDGTIGDAAHANRVSDHNPDKNGVVAAIDITHDPAHGLDIQKLADKLVASKDTRIKYVIANRRIWESGAWKTYTASDPHINHLHLSVNAVNYDDAREWNIKGGGMEQQIKDLNARVDLQTKQLAEARATETSLRQQVKDLIGQVNLQADQLAEARATEADLRKQLAAGGGSFVPVGELFIKK